MTEPRELSPSDRDAACALWATAGLTRPWNDPAADFDRAMVGPSSTVLGTLRDGHLTGTVMVGSDGHRGWVYYLAVAPEQRQHGLGADLMAAAEVWLRERDVPKLNLMVRHDNTVAVAFYERLGYSPDAVVTLAKRLS